MKNKGFTLIELLAVILILGIIALIAIPTVTSVVEQSRKGAFENTVDAVTKAIEEYAMKEELNGSSPLNGVYSMKDLIEYLDLKGDYDIDGYVELYNSQIINYSFSNDKYVVSGNVDGKETIVVSELEKSVMNGLYPYRDDYKNLIVNAYFTYGDVPSDIPSNHKWSMSDDGKITAYITENRDDTTKYDLYIVSNNVIQTPNSIASMFYQYLSLKNVFFENIDTSNTAYMGNMFSGSILLEYVNVEKLNTSKTKNFSYMFWHAESLKSIDLSKWDTSSLLYIGGMFGYCKSLTTLDVSTLNVSNVKSLSYVFSNCLNLKEIKGLNTWNVSNVEESKETFKNMSNIEELDLTSWSLKKDADTSLMFRSSVKLKKIYVSDKWDVSSVTTSTEMFNISSSLEGAVKYDASNANDVTFANCTTGYLTCKG